MDIRFTPNFLNRFAFSEETVAGLHSTVHSSAPSKSRRSMAFMIRRQLSKLSNEGVPPPKKTVLGFKEAETSSSSSIRASTYLDICSPLEASE